jgi:hypothetical protein
MPLDPEERYLLLRNMGYPEGVARLPRLDQAEALDAHELAMKVLAGLLVIGDVPNV